MTHKIQLFCLFTTLCSGVVVAASPVAYGTARQALLTA
jgi:hypothetical protein